MTTEPVARLIDVTPPLDQQHESELGFWRRKALEHAQCITQLQSDLVALDERLNAVLGDGDA